MKFNELLLCFFDVKRYLKKEWEGAERRNTIQSIQGKKVRESMNLMSDFKQIRKLNIYFEINIMCIDTF